MLTPDQINALNPWWTDPTWDPASDVHLAAAAQAPFTWDPRPFDAADVTSGAVFTLRGPRQSGKTTLTKRLIAERVAAGRAHRTCFLTLRMVATQDDLNEALETVLRLWPDDQHPWLFVLDELTFVKGWANVVGHLHEHNPSFKRATVLLTGSSAADLVESADILHGRRGRGRHPLDRLHTAMTFRDYVAARAPAALPPERISLGQMLTPEGRHAVLLAALRATELDQYLGEYALSGGLPAPIADMLATHAVDPGTVQELWRGLSADVRRLDRSEDRLEKLLSRLVVALGSLTNLSDLAVHMGVTKPTASSYLDLLAKSFGLMVIHQPDPRRQGGPSPTKPRKLYFGDAGFAAIPSILGGPTPALPALVENLLAIALFRHAERDGLERYSAPRRLFFWRSSDGREIDFLTEVAGRNLPLESKYAVAPTGKDYESMTKAFGRGVMVSRRTTVTDREILTVPAGVLLSLLG